MSTLDLQEVVDVTISVGPVSPVRTKFDLGLIIGESLIVDADERVKVYSSTTDMKIDGWLGTEPEFKAAQLYFSQVPRPQKIAIGIKVALQSAAEAVAACRQANSEWYAVYVCGTAKADIIEVAEYIESASPSSAYFYNTSDSDILSNTAGNLVETLSGKSLNKTIGQFSSTDHAIVAAMGYAMGANTQTENSAFTLKFKKQVGVKTENLTNTQLAMLRRFNCNAYISRGTVYNLFEDGVMANGVPFDEGLQLDVLKNDIQVSIMNKLQNSPKIPQTEPGMQNLLGAIIDPLEKHRGTGFIAEGVWNGQPILDTKTGDVLPRGYRIISGSIDEQSQADREARKAPPVYVLVKLAGAIENVSVAVFVNR